MRVVFLTHNYPRHSDDVAGNFLHPLAQSIISRGIDLRVLAPSDGGKGGEELLDGVPVKRVRYADAARENLAYRGTMSDALRSPGGMRALSGLIRAFTRAAKEELDGAEDGVIHAHWWVPAGLASPAKVPLVITCHGTDVRLLETSRTFRFFGRRVLRRADQVTTVSQSLAEAIEQHCGVTVSPDAVLPMPIVSVPRPRSSGGGGIIILGRLTGQKRVELALDGYALARQRGLDLPLTIVGDGPERARLMTHAGGLQIGSAVTFVGSVGPSEVPHWLSRADLVLMTAEEEGLGLAAVEALIQGVPVLVCDDGGGLLDLVRPGGGGMSVSPEPEALAQGIVTLLADEEAGGDAMKTGAVWADRLEPAAVAERCESWYHRALEAHR